MIKGLSSAILILALSACSTSSTKSKSTAKNIDTTILAANNIAADEIVEEQEIAHYFVVIADTGRDYHFLRNELSTIEKTLGIPIDTMGRYYSSTKDMVIVPENDADEIYAGEYFPRRFPSVSSSIEYLYAFAEKADPKTMAVVTGIYEQKNDADSACRALQSVAPAAFVLPSDIYIGCMH